MRVLVTGGAGYIGSHTLVALLERGHEVFVIDSFANSSPRALERVEQITGRAPAYFDLDLRDDAGVDEVFSSVSPMR